MKTTPEKAKAYIEALPRAALELLARNVLNVLALEHDEEHDPAVLTDEKTHDSMCDAYDAIDSAARVSGLTIAEIDAFRPIDKPALVSRFHAFHWPDHQIGKRESRRIRDEHNALYNSHAELLEVFRNLLHDDTIDETRNEIAIRDPDTCDDQHARFMQAWHAADKAVRNAEGAS